jgi:seryl-tRNA synthetase
MHDLRALRETPDAFTRGWASRGLEPPTAELLALGERLRAAQTALQTGQSRRNDLSKLIGQAKGRKDEAEAQRLMAEVEALKSDIGARTDEERALTEQLSERLAALP